MITQRGRVVAVADNEVWVEVSRRTACTACKQAKGCSVALLADWFDKRSVPLRMTVSDRFCCGDEVLLGIAEPVLLKNALYIYFIPLLALLLGAGFGEFLFGADEITVILFGFGALFLALYWLRYRTRRSPDPGLQPVILKSLPPAADRSVCSRAE